MGCEKVKGNKISTLRCHPSFHRLIKSEAASKGMKIIPFTKSITEDGDIWKKLKKNEKEKWNFRL